MIIFNKLTLDETCQKLIALNSPRILLHNRPDGDTVGSGIALCRMLRSMGKDAFLICADRLPRRLEFLVEEGDFAPLPLTGEHDVVAVDVASPAQMGPLRKVCVDKYAPVLMIDHHEVGEIFADHFINPDAAAAGEVVFVIAKHLEKLGALTLTKDMLSPLFAAISSDSGCFRFSCADANTHNIIADMLTLFPDIDTADINLRLFDSKSLSQMRAESFAAANLEHSEDFRIVWLSVSAADRADFDLNEEDFETAIDIIRSLAGCEVAFTVKENRDGKFKASLRSTGFNVAHIASKFRGGGHDRASGCAVDAKTLDEAVAKILAAIMEEKPFA